MRYEDSKDIETKLGKLTAEQLWVITKIAKTVRLRCRNNTAFNNYMNRIFPYARFEQVTKHKPDGSTYPGLSICGTNDTMDEQADGTQDSGCLIRDSVLVRNT